uniref:Phospholipid scramblase n=1 Tax=Hucho hucho TaxID=62062 RepID=A0A4W5MKH0_9TELE
LFGGSKWALSSFVPPQAPVMMPAPLRPLGCPPELEYLTQIDQLLVHQKVNLAEVVLDWEVTDNYIVMNSVGQQVFAVAEENDSCTLQFCCPDRPFTLHIQDNLGQEVMTLIRPLRCDSCCFPCCLQELEVPNPSGNPIGYVVQDWHPYLPKLTVQNKRREPQLKIQGACVVCQCWSDVNFDVKSLDETVVVGQINLDVKVKAVMLGACFLIDIMYFKKSVASPQALPHT